jgi:hypothetical protein
MPVLLTGWNPFYEGWLARIANLPCNPTGSLEDREAYSSGWGMADETSLTGRGVALAMEMARGDKVFTEYVNP